MSDEGKTFHIGDKDNGKTAIQKALEEAEKEEVQKAQRKKDEALMSQVGRITDEIFPKAPESSPESDTMPVLPLVEEPAGVGIAGKTEAASPEFKTVSDEEVENLKLDPVILFLRKESAGRPIDIKRLNLQWIIHTNQPGSKPEIFANYPDYKRFLD